MDIYHRILQNLYDVTGGKDSQVVDLKDIVKNQGFLGNYERILQMLSGQGWIAETPKANYVRITHWGVKEAEKSGSGEPSKEQTTKKEIKTLAADAKQFSIMIEGFASEMSKENFEQIEKKSKDINASVGKLKTMLE